MGSSHATRRPISRRHAPARRAAAGLARHGWIERVIRAGIREHGGVVLGRAAAIVLHDHPTALPDPAALEHYHMVLDSTRIPLEDCTELIVEGSVARTRVRAEPV